jgi:TnpA family transposase
MPKVASRPSDHNLRRRTNLGLNKGEARNALARAIYFCRLGEIRDRTFENQFCRAVAFADLTGRGRRSIL